MSRTTRASRSVAGRVRVARVRMVAVAVVAMSIVYGWLVPSGARPTGWEHTVALWIRVSRGSGLSTLVNIVIEAGSPVAVAAIAVGLAAGLIGSGRTRTAAVAFVSGICGSLGAEVAKHVVGRRIG